MEKNTSGQPSGGAVDQPSLGGDTNSSPLPAISLPKSGGAIQGMGEKFDVNPVTGTGSATFPIPVSPARGLEPSLTLSYSGSGSNGPFGYG